MRVHHEPHRPPVPYACHKHGPLDPAIPGAQTGTTAKRGLHPGAKVRTWQARILDRAPGKHVSLGTFPTKQSANAALNRAVADQPRGKWVSLERGRVTVADYAGGPRPAHA